MATGDNKTTDLIDRIVSDDARQAALSAEARKPTGPSFLGRPAVAAVSLLLFVVSAVWAYRQESIPSPPQIRDERVQAARGELVDARAAVQAYRAQHGVYPENLDSALGTVRASHFGYAAYEGGFALATNTGDEVVWLDHSDNPDRFLDDGSHVPLPPASPAQ